MLLPYPCAFGLSPPAPFGIFPTGAGERDQRPAFLPLAELFRRYRVGNTLKKTDEFFSGDHYYA